MLADMCSTPDCCFPLMQDRTGIRVCVSCGSKALPTQQGVDPKAGDAGLAKANDSLRVPVSSVSLTTRDSDGGAQQRQQQPPGDDGGEGAILSKVEFARVRKRRDEVSAALGRYMMQGWAMLEKKCTREGCGPGTPLLKERGTGRLYCVGCQMYSDVDGELGSAGGSQEAATSVSTPLPLKRGSSGRDHGALTVDATSAVAEVEPLQVRAAFLVERVTQIFMLFLKNEINGFVLVGDSRSLCYSFIADFFGLKCLPEEKKSLRLLCMTTVQQIIDYLASGWWFDTGRGAIIPMEI